MKMLLPQASTWLQKSALQIPFVVSPSTSLRTGQLNHCPQTLRQAQGERVILTASRGKLNQPKLLSIIILQSFRL